MSRNLNRSRGDEVIHCDPQSVGQLAQSVHRAAIAARFNIHDLHPADAGGARQGRLRECTIFTPDAQRGFPVDETVNHLGRDKFFLATGDPRFDGQRRLDIGKFFFQGTQTLILALGIVTVSFMTFNYCKDAA